MLYQISQAFFERENHQIATNNNLSDLLKNTQHAIDESGYEYEVAKDLFTKIIKSEKLNQLFTFIQFKL